MSLRPSMRPVMRRALRGALSGNPAGGLPALRSIAFMGDSITAQSTTGLVQYEADGYLTWARMFGGSRWDAEPNGSALTFATGGYDSFQVGSVHLPQALASDADTAFVHCGTNDFSDGTSSAAVAAEILRIWTELRAGGIRPIGSTILPVVGNATKSTWIAATNALIRANAAANGIDLCDWTNEIDTGTDTGVSTTTFVPDNVHPGHAGAARLGRYLSAFLAANFRLPFDPWESPGTLVSRNAAFAGSAGQPTSWNAPVVPSGGTLNSKSLVADSETGGNWWQWDITRGSATGFFTAQLDFTAQPSIVGQSIYGMMDVEVVSGSFIFTQLRTSASSNAYDMLNTAADLTVASADGAITSADGVVTLRTPPITVPGGNTYYTPLVSLTGTGVIRFRRAGLYAA